MFAIKRPIAVFMFTIALAIFGFRSMQNIRTSFLPEIEYPEFIIVCDYPNSSAEEVARYITEPLEGSLASLPALQDMISYSRDGYAIIDLKFEWKIDAHYTLLRIREKIDVVSSSFPKGAQRPFIMDFNPGSMPIVEFTFSGPCSLPELSRFAEDVIKPRFSQIDGVASALIEGIPTDAVMIIVNSEKCSMYDVSHAEIESAINNNLPNRSFSQRVKVGYAEHSMTINFPIDNIGDLLNIPVKNNGSVIKLGNLARVRQMPVTFRSQVYNDTIPALNVNLYKESGSNAIEASRMAVEELEKLEKSYPEFDFQIIKNQGEYVEESMSGLKQSIGLGAFFAFFVILLFLKDFRYSIILSIVIPVSLLLTFNALFLHNITFNIMTLGGLALGIGLIVDNGIVILDSINKNYDPADMDKSIYLGTKKVRRAIAGSTFTTVAIFFPIIYVKGYAAVLFKEQALAITYMLLASLIAAITLVPSLFKVSLRPKREKQVIEKRKGFRAFIIKVFGYLLRLPLKVFTYSGRMFSFLLAPVYRGFDFIYFKIKDRYHHALVRILNNKKLLLALLLSIAGIAFAGYKFVLSRQYWPDVPSNLVEIQVDIPAEYPFEIIREETEKTISNLLNSENVAKVICKTHDPFSVSHSSVQDYMIGPGYYSIDFKLLLKYPIKSDGFSRSEYSNRVTLPYEKLAINHPTALKKELSGRGGKNFIVYFNGDNHAGRNRLAAQYAGFLKNHTPAKEIIINDGGRKNMFVADYRESVLEKYNLNPGNTAAMLKTMTGGQNIGWWEKGEDKLPILLQVDTVGIKEMSHVLAKINNPASVSIRNEQIFDIRKTAKLVEELRVNRKPVISVEAHSGPGDLAGIHRKTEEWIQGNGNRDIEMFIAGESKRIFESFSDLYKSFLLATIIVYLILAAQFESFLHPLNIILTVPIGVIGSIIGLMICGLSLNVISLIGVVMLIGIGVNDAIVKLDYMVFLKQNEKFSTREAVLKASEDKFRPIVMTTMTTIVAMLPMAFGYGGNAEINQPLAVTIIGGLFFTTVLTLFVTPVVFEIMENSPPTEVGG
jgi:HAE1 family hydrophobic/amphiphilic exporter-1